MYIKSVPHDLFFVWKFGQEGYDFHSTEARINIQKVIENKKMQKMIKEGIGSLKDYMFTVKYGFSYGDNEEDIEHAMFAPPEEKMFEVKEHMVKVINEDKRNNTFSHGDLCSSWHHTSTLKREPRRLNQIHRL